MKGYKELSSRYLRIQKRRTILTIIGIILSVALITGVQILYSSMLDFWERDARKNADYHGYFYDLDYENAIRIKNHIDIKKAVLLKEDALTAINVKDKRFINSEDKVEFGHGDGGGFEGLRVKSTDEEGFKKFKVKLVSGALPKSKDEIVISERAYKNLSGIKIGDNVRILVGTKVDKNGKELEEGYGGKGFKVKGEKSYKLVGIIKEYWFFNRDSDVAFTYLDGDLKGVYSVFIDVKNPRKTYNTANKIGRDLKLPVVKENRGSDYKFYGNEDILFVYGGSAYKENELTVILLVALITGIIVISTIAVIYNSFNISVIEKSSEYGLLRSVGASPNQIKSLVLREASLMSIFGIPLGILSGFIGIKGLYSVLNILNYKLVQELSLRIVIRPNIFIVTILVSILTIYISAMMPAIRAARVSPIEALKRVDRSIKIKKLKKSKLIRRLFGTEGEIAYKNLRRNKKRLIVTVFSLALSVTLYIGFDSLVKQVFYVSKNQELSKYSYVIVAADKEKSKKVFEDLKSMDKVERVYSNSDTRIIARAEEGKLIKENIWWNPEKNKPLYMYNSSLHVMDKDYISELKGHLLKGRVDLKELDKGGVILLQKNIRRVNNEHEYTDYTNYKIGDNIVFTDTSDFHSIEEEWDKLNKIKTKVVAILNDLPGYSDEYPRQGLYLITTEKGVEKLNMKVQPPKIHVYKKPKVNGKDVVAYINDAKGKKEITYFHNVEEASEEDRQFFITISILVYGFITLIILISSVNIFNTIASNLYTRKKELGVIKSIGMSQGSLRKMIYLEGVYYGIYAIVFGGVAGTILSYIFFRILNVSVNIKWTTSLKSFLTAAIGVMVITTVSTYLPLRKLNEDSIIESIRNEE